MVGAILLHQDGTFVQIALAAAERDLFSIIESELAVAQWAVHQDRQLCIGAFDGAQVSAVLLGDLLHAGPFRVVVGHPHLFN